MEEEHCNSCHDDGYNGGMMEFIAALVDHGVVSYRTYKPMTVADVQAVLDGYVGQQADRPIDALYRQIYHERGSHEAKVRKAFEKAFASAWKEALSDASEGSEMHDVRKAGYNDAVDDLVSQFRSGAIVRLKVFDEDGALERDSWADDDYTTAYVTLRRGGTAEERTRKAFEETFATAWNGVIEGKAGIGKTVG